MENIRTSLLSGLQSLSPQVQAPPASGLPVKDPVDSSECAGNAPSVPSGTPLMIPKPSLTRKADIVAAIPSDRILSFTDSEKSEMSRMVLEDVELKNGFYVDEKLNEYLKGLVQQIKDPLLPGHGPSKIRVVNSDEENAFITPDESIYITKGLLQNLDTEEELMAVFAHELGHARYKHLEKEYEKNEKMQKAGINQIIKYVVRNEYSKECEFQADSFAVEAMLALGRDPAGVRGLFGKFEEQENKQWEEFRAGMLKKPENKGSLDTVDEKVKQDQEKAADRAVDIAKTAQRFLRSHPYASERLERACIQIKSDSDNSRAYSSGPVKCRIEEEAFVQGLAGTFDEKLQQFGERYPDGRAGKSDEKAQMSFFGYSGCSGELYEYHDGRAKMLNFFASSHARSPEDFQKIFAEQKVLNGDAFNAYFTKLTEGSPDRIGELEKLWKMDCANNFLAYGFPDFENYGKDNERYCTRSIPGRSKFQGTPADLYKEAKRFAFRSFVRNELYDEVKTRDDLKRVLDLPFMSLEDTPVVKAEKFPVLASCAHNEGIMGQMMKVYKNETGKEAVDGAYLSFFTDIFKERRLNQGILGSMADGLEAWYGDLEKKGSTAEYFRSLRDFVDAFPGAENERAISENIVNPVLFRVEPKDFERGFCSIFTKESPHRDGVLAERIIRNCTMEKVQCCLPYLSAGKRESLEKAVHRSDGELSFKERTAILKALYPMKSIKTKDKADELAMLLFLLCKEYARTADDVSDIFKAYSPLKERFETRSFSFHDADMVKKMSHPITLRNSYGDDLPRKLSTAAALANCSTLAPGLSMILKIADHDAQSTEDMDISFGALRTLAPDTVSPVGGNEWQEHLESLYNKGMEFSARKHGGNFDRIFDDLNRWALDLKMTTAHSKFPRCFSEGDTLREESLLKMLKNYGRDAGDAVKVINAIRRNRQNNEGSQNVINKAMKIKDEIEGGYDRNLVMAGFTGYFLQEKAGKLPSDLDEHLRFIEAMMPDATAPRDAVVRTLLEKGGLSVAERLRIVDLLSDFKEKTEIQGKLYDSAVKSREDYESLPYRQKVDMVTNVYTEPSRERDRVLSSLEKTSAQSTNETHYSDRLKFDKTSEKARKESTYGRNNRYLLDPENRAQAIAALSAGTLTKILQRYFKGPGEDSTISDEDSKISDEEKKLYYTISKLEPLDRKRIIKEMLVGLDAFEADQLKDIAVENRTGAFSVKAWKKEFIDSIIDNVFKSGGEKKEDDFSLWMIREIFNEASVDRSATIISELIEAQKGDLTSEQLMFRFLKAGGPITRKLGQILSSNSLVPQSYQKEFANLKLAEDSPMEKEQIIRTVKSDLDGKMGEGSLGGIHVEHYGQLLGSASIRTVYRVQVNGRDFVAKINDPAARAMALEDLDILDALSAKLDRSPELKEKFGLQNPRLLLHNLALSLFQDIDSRIELINSRKLEQVIDLEGNHTSKIFYAGPNVVLEEAVDGKGLHKAIEKFGLDRKQVARRILTAYAGQIDKGIFHADPHSENVMLSKNGDVYWIDKSMQGDFTIDDVSVEEKKAIFDILFDIGVFGSAGVMHGRASGLIMKHFDDMARIKPGTEEEKEKVRNDVRAILGDGTKSTADKFYAMEQAAEKGGYVFSDNVFMLGKSLITMSGEVKKIDADADVGDYLKKVLIKDMGRRALEGVKNFFSSGEKAEKKDFLEQKGISSLSTLDWNAMESGNLVSGKLKEFGVSEFRSVKTDEDAVGALKHIFLKYGDRLSVEDVYFLMNLLKSDDALAALQQRS